MWSCELVRVFRIVIFDRRWQLERIMSLPIFEPEFAFLPHACECGARTLTQADLDLHKREICGRRFNPNYKQPSLSSYKQPSLFSGMLPGTGGVADGGRRT
jgi:hypothetical protein